MAHWIEGIFAFLFKYRPAVFEKGDLAFGAPASVIALLLVAAAIGVPAVLTYAMVRGKSTRRDRWVLGTLRVAALVVLIVCLFRPMLLLSAAEKRNSRTMNFSRSALSKLLSGPPKACVIQSLRGCGPRSAICMLRESSIKMPT